MRVNRSQIVNGLTDYIRSDITPKMDKAMQIILSVGVNSALANNRIMDSVFDNTIVSSLLEDDGSGTYEITGVLDAMKKAIDQYGSFPVTIPAIPLLSPREITLNLDASDVESIRRRIGGYNADHQEII